MLAAILLLALQETGCDDGFYYLRTFYRRDIVLSGNAQDNEDALLLQVQLHF